MSERARESDEPRERLSRPVAPVPRGSPREKKDDGSDERFEPPDGVRESDGVRDAGARPPQCCCCCSTARGTFGPWSSAWRAAPSSERRERKLERGDGDGEGRGRGDCSRRGGDSSRRGRGDADGVIERRDGRGEALGDAVGERPCFGDAGTDADSRLPAGRPGDARYGPVESSSSAGCEPARCRGRGDQSSVGWTRHARDAALGVESARPRPHGRGDVTRYAASEALVENVRDRCDCCDCCGGGAGG